MIIKALRLVKFPLNILILIQILFNLKYLLIILLFNKFNSLQNKLISIIHQLFIIRDQFSKKRNKIL